MHLYYPHICLACGSDELANTFSLCNNCILQLPYTSFFSIPSNLVEKIFWGRCSIANAGALLFFTKDSIVQLLLFELKYKQNKQAGFLLGVLLGQALMGNATYENIDLLIPIPITNAKRKIRGFNQTEVIIKGIQTVWNKPSKLDALIKTKNNVSQTLKDRLQRENQNGFSLNYTQKHLLKNKHILLIDDVITTGATLENAAICLHQTPLASISIAVIAYTL